MWSFWPKTIYEREAFRQLRDGKCYKKLVYNPLSNFQEELVNIVDQAYQFGTITEGTRESLIIEYPKVACLYLLPKVHKNMQVSPGHPVVSGNEGLCDAACKFLDMYLKLIVELLLSYARDTGDVIRKIENI